MTYLYRCQFCASNKEKSARASRDHLFRRHRERLIRGLGLIETFGTPPYEGHPFRPPTARPDANPGASGEGDSS